MNYERGLDEHLPSHELTMLAHNLTLGLALKS